MESSRSKYWDDVSDSYDSLYKSRWFQMEDQLVLEFIKKWHPKVEIPTSLDVLDLGCGTGLGGILASHLNSYLNYTGVDISKKMIARASERIKHLHPRLIQSEMSSIPTVATASQDLVLCLYTSLSYAGDPSKAIGEMHRTLRSSGVIICSVLSRFSLSRLQDLKVGKTTEYRTRGDTSRKNSTTATCYSTPQFRSILHDGGFRILELVSIGSLVKISDNIKFWKIDRLICNMVPGFGHTLFAACCKL